MARTNLPEDLYLTRTYRQKVIGVDISGGSFPRRRHTSDGQRFRCIRKNAKQLGFVKDASLDAVVSMLAFHEMEHPKAILAEAYRILRPGGELLIVDFPRDSLAQELWDENYYRPEEIEMLLKEAGFKGATARLIEQEQIIWVHGYQPAATGEPQCHG